MSGSRTKQREYRQVIFGIRGSEHVKVVTKVMPFPVGIPADVAVGLVIDSVALTVSDALFQAVAGAGLTLSCTSIDRCSITGNSQIIQVNKPLIDGSIQELGFENLKQACSWVELFGRFYSESVQEVIDGDFLYRWSLFPFFVRLFWLLLGRVDWIRDVIAVRTPQTAEKIIKSTCAGRIPNREP